jgi:hypothetical protein
LLILREVEKRSGKPAAFIESDLVDPRYFSAANIKNRLESYFQMIQQKRTLTSPTLLSQPPVLHRERREADPATKLACVSPLPGEGGAMGEGDRG